MPSARPKISRRLPRLALLGICGLLLVGALGGCSTTQEKATREQARARQILKRQAQRKRERHDKSQREGS